jgi:hypothetical protein
MKQALAESTGYGIVSGCEPSISGLTVTVGTGVVHLADGTRKEIAATNITLDAADASNPRIDLVYIDSTGTVAKITGTASASPSAPALPSGGISVCNVMVAAGAITGTVNHVQTIAPNLANYGIANVKDYGAIGDGTADDTAAIQSAIDNSTAVFFPSGTYKITSTVNVSKAKDIVGNNASIVCGTNGLDYMFDVSGKNNVTFSNLHFNSNLVGRGSIQFYQCEDCKVDKCSFTGYTAEYGHYQTDSQVMDYDCVRTTITNCLFYNNGNQYDASLDTLNRCITTQDGENCIISMCRFVNFNQGIVYTSPDLQVENCYFEGNNDNCIYGSGSASITGNIFKNANDEDVVVGTGNFIINDNQFMDGTNKLIAVNSNCTSMVVNGNTFVCKDSNKDPMILYYRDKTYVIDDLLFTNNIVIAENEKNTGYGNYFYIGGFTHCQISGNSMLFASNINYSRAIYFDVDAVGSTLNIVNNRFKNKNIYANCFLLNSLINTVANINDNLYQNIVNADRDYEVDLTAYLATAITNKLTAVVATVAKYRGYSVWNIKFTTTDAIARYEQLFNNLGDIFSTTKLSADVSMSSDTYIIKLRPGNGYILTDTAIPSGTTVKFQVMVGVDS